MYNYPVVDAEGKLLGVMSLAKEDIPFAMVNGAEYSISIQIGRRAEPPQNPSFVLAPVPAIPATPEPSGNLNG